MIKDGTCAPLLRLLGLTPAWAVMALCLVLGNSCRGKPQVPQTIWVQAGVGQRQLERDSHVCRRESMTRLEPGLFNTRERSDEAVYDRCMSKIGYSKAAPTATPSGAGKNRQAGPEPQSP